MNAKYVVYGFLGMMAIFAPFHRAFAETDVEKPVVGAVTPTTGQVGVSTTLTATYSDNVGVTGCVLNFGGDALLMTVNSGIASYTNTFDLAGAFLVSVYCADAAGNVGIGSEVTVTVAADTEDPTVGLITPTTATVGVATTLSVTYSDNVDVKSCSLYVNDDDALDMDVNAGTATYSNTFESAGTYTMWVTCVDDAGNVGIGNEVTVTVTAVASDTTAPTVGALAPTSATAGVATTFSGTYADAVGVVSCTAYFDGAGKTTALSSGTASASKTFGTAGSYSAYMTCVDAAGNVGTGATVTVTVAAASSDTTPPTIGAITQTTATQNTPVTLSATITDASGIQSCNLYVNDSNQGAMTASSSTYSRSYTPASSGIFSAYAVCVDAAGNSGSGIAAMVTVAASTANPGAADTVAPTVGAISPTVVSAGVPVTLTASVEDSGGISSCTLYVNSTYIGSMTKAVGYATYLYTFPSEGNAIANAYCVDTSGNATRGASSTITIITEQSPEQLLAVDAADNGDLIKLACGPNADVQDYCHAVYYYDGTRHAFPNEKVYMTWYSDYDDVVIVTDDFMASIVLGDNVTYHPGTRMVKFVTVNTVYAVGEQGELRAVASESVAASIWGSDWNTKIDDISDAFYSNYTFGDSIESASDFDPEAVEASVTDIEEIL